VPGLGFFIGGLASADRGAFRLADDAGPEPE